MIMAVTGRGRLTAMRAVLFHVGVAGRAGLDVTGFDCLAVLDGEGPLPPHDLAQRTGLTRDGAAPGEPVDGAVVKRGKVRSSSWNA
jgi:hypothetical protein